MLCQQTSPKHCFANVNMTSYFDVTNSWRGTFARLFQFKPGIELSWCPPVPIQAGNRTIRFPGRELIFSQIANALPTGLKKRLPSPCGSRHYEFRRSSFRPSLHIAARRHLASVWLVLSAGEEPLDFVDFSVCNGPSAITQRISSNNTTIRYCSIL